MTERLFAYRKTTEDIDAFALNLSQKIESTLCF